MSNRDIGDIYRNMRAGERYEQPVRESDLYTKVLHEQYMISIQDDAGNVVYKSSIQDEEEVEKIKKNLDRSQRIKVGREELTVYDMVDKVLAIDGWKQNNKNYKDQVFEPIKRAIHGVDINRDSFGGLIKLQTDKNNPFRTKLLSNPGTVFNFMNDLISPIAINMFASVNDAHTAIKAIWDLDTKISGISVGRGEICISLFSDAIKGAKGDLDMPGIGEVELKGSGARVGGDGYAHIKTTPSLDKILQSRKVKVNDYQLNQIKNYAIKTIQSVVGARADQTRIDWSKKTAKIIQNIAADTDIKSIIKDVEKAVKQKVIPSGKGAPVITALNNYMKRQNGEIGGIFSGAVNAFFRSDWNLSSNEIVDGLVECRSTKSADINSLKAGLYQLIQHVNILDDSTNVSNLARCIAAIHLSCYQNHEGFPFIVLSNDDTKSMVAIEFDKGESQGDVMLRCFDIFTKLNIKINLAVDEKFKSTGITLP